MGEHREHPFAWRCRTFPIAPAPLLNASESCLPTKNKAWKLNGILLTPHRTVYTSSTVTYNQGRHWDTRKALNHVHQPPTYRTTTSKASVKSYWAVSQWVLIKVDLNSAYKEHGKAQHLTDTVFPVCRTQQYFVSSSMEKNNKSNTGWCYEAWCQAKSLQKTSNRSLHHQKKIEQS